MMMADGSDGDERERTLRYDVLRMRERIEHRGGFDERQQNDN